MARRDPTAVWIRRRKGKRGVTYGLRWTDPLMGQGRSESCGANLAYARERRKQIRRELQDGLSGKIPNMSLGSFSERLKALMAGKSPQTITKTTDSLRLLGDLSKVHRLDGINRAIVMDFRAKRLDSGLSPATVNKDLRQIKSALSYAVDAGLLRTNPLLRWRSLMLREPEKQPRVIEKDEFERLLAACENPGFRALLLVGYCQGLRRQELVNLRWSAVDLERDILHVVNIAKDGEFTKNRKNRSIPMHPDAQAVLSELYKQVPKVVRDGQIAPRSIYAFTWPDGTPFRADWATCEFRRLMKKAGLAHCTLHDLRRSFSTLAQRAGVDKYTVKDLGGWSVVSVVERHYTGDVSEALRKAMQTIAETA